MADNEIEVDFVPVDQGMASELEKFSSALKVVLSDAMKVRDTFVSTSNQIKQLPGQMAELKKQMASAVASGNKDLASEIKDQIKAAGAELKNATNQINEARSNLQIASEGRAQGANALLGAQTGRGGTFGDAATRNQAIGLVTNVINTDDAQMAARIADAAGKAAERLIKTAEASLIARFNQVGVSEQIRQQTYTNSAAMQAQILRARIGTEKLVRDYGPDAPQTLAAREQERAAALAQRTAAEMANRTFDQTRSGLAGAREASRDSSFANRYGVERQAFQQRIQGENLSITEQRDMLRELAATRKAALADASRQESEAWQLNKAFDNARAKYAKDEAALIRSQAATQDKLFEERRKQAAANLYREAAQENARLTPEIAARQASRDTSFTNRYGTERTDFVARVKAENLSIDEQRLLLRQLADEQKKANDAKRLAPKVELSPEQLAAQRAARRAAQNEQLNDRLEDNGGATFFGFQARIAANYAIFGAAVSAVRGAMGAIIEFDDVLHKFQAITATTDTEMQKFRGQLLGIASDSKFSVTEIGQVAIALGQTGLSAGEVAKALKPVIDLATASGSTLQQAVEAVTGVLGAYAMEASRAGDVSDVFVGALNRTKLTMDQLQLGIQYAANIARDSGVSFSELTATIGAVANAGVKSGSTIGTGVRQLITELSSPTEKFRTVLRELGVNLSDVDLKTNGLAGVLSNLRDKGFTTADALRALDLRAAAAFSALAGQGDRVKTLQQELLLSSAAAEASTKANESLAAGFQRFQNSAFAVVDKALHPMVEALKGATSGVTSLFQGLGMLGPILPVIGTGLASLAAAATALKLGSLITGLVSGAALSVPVIAAAGGITALIAGGALISYLELLDSKADQATKRLDQLKAAENDVKGQVTSLETNTNSINSTILQLIDRREKLNADPMLRRTAVIEAQKAFGELGLTISSSIGNIDELVEALQRLRTGLATQSPNVLLDQLRLIREETKQLLILQEEQSKKNRSQFVGSAVAMGDFTAAPVGMVDPLDRFSQFQGSGFDRARDIIRSPGQFGTEIMQAAGPAYAALQDQQTAARTARANAMAAGNLKEAELQDRRLTLLGDLNKLIADTVSTQNNINAKRMEEERLVQSQDASLITARPEMQDMAKQLDSAYAERSKGQRAALTNLVTTDLGKRQQLSDNLEVSKLAGNALLASLNAMGEKMKADGIADGAVEEALAPFRNRIADLTKGVDEPLRQIFDAVSQGARSLLETENRGLQMKIEQRLKTAGSARDQISITAAEAEIKAATDRQSQIRTELARLQVVNPEEVENNPAIRDKLTQEQENLKTQIEGYADKIAAARRKVTEQLLQYRDIGDNAYKDRLTKEAARLQKIVDDANTTPEKARELVAEINRLLTEAANIAKRVNATEVERKLINAPSDTGTAIPGERAADGSVAKQIIDAANAKGADAGMTRYLLALAQLESSQDPTRTNPSGATGLLQFMNTARTPTWQRSGGGDIFSIQDQVRNGITFTNQNDKAFRDAMGRDPTGEERFVLHNQGAGGGLGLLQNPNSRAVDQVSAAAVTGNAGRTDMTASEFVDVLKGMYRTAMAKTEGQSRSATEIIKESGAEKDAAVDEKLAQDREKGEKRVREIERNNKLIELKAVDREDLARYEGQASLVRRALNPSDAMTASTQALQSLAEMRQNALEKDKIQNRGRPEAQQTDDQLAINSAFRDKAQTQAIAAAEAVGKVTLKVYDDQLEQAQARIKDLKRDSSDGKYNADELNSLNAQVEALQKKKELQGQLESYEASIASLNQSLNTIQDSGLGNRKDMLRITEQIAALEAKRVALAPSVERSVQMAKSQPSMSNAASLGVDDFMKSRGITDNMGNLVSATAQARKMISADLNVLASGFDNLFTNLFNGSMKAGDALKKFATDILSGMLSQATKALTNSLFAGIFGGKGGEGGLFSGGAGGGGLFSMIQGMFGGAANGGMPVPVPGMAGGGEVTGAIPNRDSALRRLMPGEFVLRRSAVQGIGRENLEHMNAMGNSMVSQTPQMSVAGLGGASARAQSNVYVVSPEAKPPPSANDVVYMVGQDIQTGGQLRKLIKSVVAGHDG